MAKDALSSLAGNRMGQLKSEIADLKAQLRKEFEPDKIAELKKLIREKETYYKGFKHHGRAVINTFGTDCDTLRSGVLCLQGCYKT